MKVKQIRKYFKRNNRVSHIIESPKPVVVEQTKEKGEKKNNKQKKEDMTLEQIEQVEALAQNLNDVPQKVKVVKKDRGLIERTESSKIVLTEDNRQVLND